MAGEASPAASSDRETRAVREADDVRGADQVADLIPAPQSLDLVEGRDLLAYLLAMAEGGAAAARGQVRDGFGRRVPSATPDGVGREPEGG